MMGVYNNRSIFFDFYAFNYVVTNYTIEEQSEKVTTAGTSYDKLVAKERNTFWNSSNTMEYRIHSVEEYATKINECKMWLGTTGPVLDVSPRYFEVMLSKTLLLCNNMPEQYEDYFTDGVNCVIFNNDLSDFDEKLDYYLNNESEMSRVIETAYDTAINNYTWHHMAKKLIEQIKEL